MLRARAAALNGLGYFLVIALALAVGWWFQREPTPWLTFNGHAALYTPADHELQITGKFTVETECDGRPDWHYIIIMWNSDIRVMRPSPIPSFSAGAHEFVDTMTWPLEEPTPHGATVRALVACSGSEILLSESAPVRMLDERPLPAHPNDFTPTPIRRYLHYAPLPRQ